MPRPEQGIARAEIREDPLDGVRYEDNIEVEPLGLMECRDGDAIVFVGLIRQERTRLEVLGFAVGAVVEEGAVGGALVPALQNLGERRPGGAIRCTFRVRGEVCDLRQLRPDLPQADAGRRFACPPAIREQRCERPAVANAGPDEIGPRSLSSDAVPLEFGQACGRRLEHRSEEDPAHGPIGFRGSVHIRGR